MRLGACCWEAETQDWNLKGSTFIWSLASWPLRKRRTSWLHHMFLGAVMCETGPEQLSVRRSGVIFAAFCPVSLTKRS